jgi:hypothetical protein
MSNNKSTQDDFGDKFLKYTIVFIIVYLVIEQLFMRIFS